MNSLKKDTYEDAAREWFLLITSGEATDADIDAFEVWRNSSPEHEGAYAQLSLAWNELGVLARSPQGECLRRSVTAADTQDWFAKRWVNSLQALGMTLRHNMNVGVPNRRVRGFGVLMTQAGMAVPILMCVLVVGALMLVFMPSSSDALRYHTLKAEMRSITLEDGSRITLGAQTQLEVRYQEEQRSVHLFGGQAFFEVAKDPVRPFYVKTNNAEFQVLGTKFDLHLGPTDVTLEVLEGRVQVKPELNRKERGVDATAETKLLTTMQGVTVSKTHIGEVITVENKPGVWREGRLVFRKATFAKVVSDANRYYRGRIILRDDKLAATDITTSFDIDQIDFFLKSLPEMFAVEVTYLPSGDVVIKPRSRSVNYAPLKGEQAFSAIKTVSAITLS